MSHDVEGGLSASLEDYLEVIFHLEKENRVARAKDIAEQMNVQRASVTGALKALGGHRAGPAPGPASLRRIVAGTAEEKNSPVVNWPEL